MLIQFNCKNFKSIRDEVSLDLTATKIKEHYDHVVTFGNDNLLKVLGIYGANASGKSTICQAFEFMSIYVLDSFNYGGENEKTRPDKTSYQMKVPKFAFDQTSYKSETIFEVFFTMPVGKNYRTYQYGFALKADRVAEEWLYSKAKTGKEYKTIFYRKGNNIEMPDIPPKSAETLKMALENETLIVSLGAKLKISKLKAIRDWFYDNEIVCFGDPREILWRSTMVPSHFIQENVQSDIVRYLSSFDTSIQGFKIEDDTENKDSIKIESYHRVIGTDEYNSISFKEESHGTLAMFSLYAPIAEALERGSVLVIDEINSRLHPLLVRNIILTFLDKKTNPNNAQLIFTTHDVWQLSNDLLRRDEIWFTEKNSEGVTDLYSLADFTDENGDKIRKDANYAKNYLVGKYGAIPQLKPIDILGVRTDGE